MIQTHNFSLGAQKVNKKILTLSSEAWNADARFPVYVYYPY